MIYINWYIDDTNGYIGDKYQSHIQISKILRYISWKFSSEGDLHLWGPKSGGIPCSGEHFRKSRKN